MREIKYRAWDLEESFMFTPTEISLRQNVNFSIEHGWQKLAWREDDSGGLGRIIGEECLIMQYTGLKDKNGIEIYEGDILHFTNMSNPPNRNQKVYMDEFTWQTDDFYFQEIIECKYEFEVIGNIYENPELT